MRVSQPKMFKILPPELLMLLSDRYIAGVENAVAKFHESSADEDAVTGALGQAISLPKPLAFSRDGSTYSVDISYEKLGGRGKGAPEKKYGCDGFFQIVILDSDANVKFAKGLPFQSKINWKNKDAKLLDQAKKMENTSNGGIVISYAETGYAACTSKIVVLREGKRTGVDKAKEMHPLGQVLGHDFLNCKVGIKNLQFDRKANKFNMVGPPPPFPTHLISTEIAINLGQRKF